MKRLRLSLFVLCVISLVLSSTISAQVDYRRRTVLDWSADGRYLAWGGWEGEVRVFDLTKRQLWQAFQAHEGQVVLIQWSPSNSKLFTGGYENVAKLWELRGETFVPSVLYKGAYGHEVSADVLSVTWKPDGSKIAMASLEIQPSLRIWDVSTANVSDTANIPSSLSIKWSFNDQYLVVGDASGSIFLYSTANFKLLHRFDHKLLHPRWVVSVDWHSNNTHLLGSDGYGRVFVWEVGNQKLVHTFNSAAVEDITVGDPFTHAALKARFSADGRSVQAINADGTIRSWDLATGQLLSEVKVASPIVSAAWSPYGAQLVVDLLNPPQGDAQDALSANHLQILVPFASLDQFKAIASVCITNAAEQAALQAKAASESLAGLSAYVSSLPVEVIPPACAADLLAIAAALQGN